MAETKIIKPTSYFVEHTPLPGKDRRQVVMIYGTPGAGKTTLATGLHNTERGKVCLVDLNHGVGSVVPAGVLKTPPIYKLTELRTAIKELQRGLPDGFDTVVIDSFTDVVNKAFEFTIKGSDEFTDLAKVSQHTWTQRNTMIRRMLSAFLAIPCKTLVFICGEIMVGPENGPFKAKPDVSPTLSDVVSGYMDVVLWVEPKENGKRFLHYGPSPRSVAKCRSHLKQTTKLYEVLPGPEQASQVLSDLLTNKL